ncbi:thioredoxin [Pseudarcicella hirudinis]|uniref:Thioredoxin n=1 Tax=Pseudarcicella hirudinis TaxID=1079859 RepID=A0A1I5WNQ5_9BACT|nr:thioredoxin domain-containing protein [Pseudarcicella hirudinis]SFQ21415.1 thioredoxin [Pseudarcicella hirudinis]
MQKYSLRITFVTILSLAFSHFCLSQVLSPNDFEKKYSENPNAQLIDVRTPGEYGGGHLPNAQNVDYRSADFAQKIQSLDKEKPVFVYCLSGGRSKAASDLLRQNGFKEVIDLQGGYLKWTSLNKPVEGSKAEKSTAEGSFSKEHIDKLVKEHKIVIMDFFATWCGPCLKMMPDVQKLKKEYEGKVLIQTIDSDQNKKIVEAYKVDEIPTFLIFKDGKQVMRAVGWMDEKGLRKMITDVL